jgi:hypothetical protein
MGLDAQRVGARFVKTHFKKGWESSAFEISAIAHRYNKIDIFFLLPWLCQGCVAVRACTAIALLLFVL